MNRSIRYFTQLFLTNLILVLVALVGFSWVCLTFLKSFITNQTIDQLKGDTEYIHALILNGAQYNELIPIIKKQSLRMTIIQTDGVVLFDSESDVKNMSNHIDRLEVSQAIRKGTGASIRYSSTLKQSFIYVATGMNNDHILRLAIPETVLKNQLVLVYRSVIIYGILIFSFCLVITYLTSRRIYAPLQWMIQTINQIKSHRFHQIKPRPSSVKEIQSANNAIVSLATDLNAYLSKLSRAKETREMILANMVNGLMVVNDALTIEIVNKAAYSLIFNVPKSNKKIALDNNPEIIEFTERILRSNQTQSMEIKHHSTLRVLISGSIYEEKNTRKVLIIAQDITQLKRLEQTRQDFVANVSHELKTPITLIRSAIETVVPTVEKTIPKSFLDMALRHTDRLTAIIDDLLQLSTLETTGKQLKKTIIPSGVLFNRVIELCEEKANKKQVIISIPDNSISLNCNLPLLEQAVRNLVDNAIKFSNEGSAITMNCKHTDKYSILEISDNGPGIDQSHISKLFQRFYRVDGARSRQMGGTGLGLAIVKHISQAHGGMVSVKSEPDKGSTFIIKIPK